MRLVRISTHLSDETLLQHACVPRWLFSVLPFALLPGLWREGIATLVPVQTSDEFDSVQQLRNAGLTRVYPLVRHDALLPAGLEVDYFVLEEGTLEPQDVVAVDFHGRQSEVLMRKADLHHTVFLTNRCNSRCIMCSQPPTPHDDSWRFQEAMVLAQSLTWSPPVFGFSGGEPLLLGDALREVLDQFLQWHPTAKLEVLTNGRLVSDGALAKKLLEGLKGTSWMVPLYGHAPFVHNHVVQAEAFDQTIAGLLNLQRFRQPIQLRAVLIQPVLRFLPELCEFIANNLPFVREVALMGCEPIGFALANSQECRLDLRDWSNQLLAGVRALDRGQVPVILMNLPLCSIDPRLWPLAHKSISDWKNVYGAECDGCVVRESCCGLFSWHEKGWAPTTLKAVKPNEFKQV